jgi:hypothetical protein
MSAEPRLWVVEAEISLTSPWMASEASRREFFDAISGLETRGSIAPEVGWAGDDTAFVALTGRGLTPEHAADAVKDVIKRRATEGARWRLTTGLRIRILSVRPIES